ncbi:P-loop containing nucleoside triphosphate hydrolase protein [Russula decolorans]
MLSTNRCKPEVFGKGRNASASAISAPPPPPPTSTPSDEPPRPAEPPVPPPPAFGAVEGTPVPPPSTSSQSKRKLRSTRGDEGSKRSRTTIGTGSTSKEYAPPTVRLSDLGGVDPCVEKMLELVAMPLTHPEVYLHTGVQPPRGELGVPFISVSAPSIVSGMSGESEKTLRETFEEAKRIAPSLLFIDEIDAITPKREKRAHSARWNVELSRKLSWEKTDDKTVVVIGATNRPDALDPALRRAGRFDHEIGMMVPDDEARAQVLHVLCAKLRLDGTFDFNALAKAHSGLRTAGIIAVKRIFKSFSDGTIVISDNSAYTIDADTTAIQVDVSHSVPVATISTSSVISIQHEFTYRTAPLTPVQRAPLCITAADFMLALKEIQPSAQREGFATVPDVTWSDIGALHATRSELHMAVVQPTHRPEPFRAVGIDAPAGVFLWGPPGCGKTLLAKAVANESQASFISVKGPELLNKYVGESERAVRQVFARARASSPCIIFFDELDALVPRRDETLSESSARVVNTLLTELDGLDARRGVFVLAAANRPDMLATQPYKLLYVDLPAPEERAEIIRTLLAESRTRSPVPLSSPQVGDDVAMMVRGPNGDGYSGADLAALVREAGVRALRRALGPLERMESHPGRTRREVQFEDFQAALGKVAPSVSKTQRQRYEALRETFASGKCTLGSLTASWPHRTPLSNKSGHLVFISFGLANGTRRHSYPSQQLCERRDT